MSNIRQSNSNQVKIAVIANTVANIEKSVNNIEAKLNEDYVTKDAYALVLDKVARLEKIVYGVIMTILAALIGGLTYLK